jgi:hypothetical protein
MTWLLFSFLTVLCWGVYGVYLYKGQTAMNDLANGRWKAFLFVGFAYFLVAVIAPLVMLRVNGASTNFFNYPGPGKGWSLVAGIVGAVGAFGVLLAFGAAPQPKAAYVPVVMSIIFAGAPIVNAFATIFYREKGSHVEIQWQFWVGLVLAAIGGSVVSLYKPEVILPPKPVAPAAAAIHGTSTQSAPAPLPAKL